jgi:hypothetical protein
MIEIWQRLWGDNCFCGDFEGNYSYICLSCRVIGSVFTQSGGGNFDKADECGFNFSDLMRIRRESGLTVEYLLMGIEK